MTDTKKECLCLTAACILLAVTLTNRTRAEVLPLSDPNNKDGWILNSEISDEFNDKEVDRDKWFIQGENGGDYYIWKGRPPSQFAEHNVLQEDGMLKIRSQWEPDFKFATESYADGQHNDTYGAWQGKPLPVTTGGIISKMRFLYGYMEVRSKAGNSNMTSSFWSLGYESELDIFEQVGNPKVKGDIHADTWKASVHDWSPPAKRPTRRFGLKSKLPFRVADAFHVYGCEWGEDYLKLFLDGELMYETTREKEGKSWVLNNPLEVWFDSEVFTWLGLPDADELPADFEIDYLRVWQKPQTNLLDRAFFGFEGPILFEDKPKPLDLVPESSRGNDYQKFWSIDGRSAKYLSIVRHERSAGGIRSLKFSQSGELPTDGVSAVAPQGSVNLPAGDFVLSAKVWIEPLSTVNSLRVTLADPSLGIPLIELAECAKGEWVTVKTRFTRDQASTSKDRLTLTIDASSGAKTVFVDDIAIEAVDR